MCLRGAKIYQIKQTRCKRNVEGVALTTKKNSNTTTINNNSFKFWEEEQGKREEPTTWGEYEELVGGKTFGEIKLRALGENYTSFIKGQDNKDCSKTCNI